MEGKRGASVREGGKERTPEKERRTEERLHETECMRAIREIWGLGQIREIWLRRGRKQIRRNE
eukprot:6177024-Pleurochrysis_carterae.AAC.1